jgi:hypothetical protein
MLCSHRFERTSILIINLDMFSNNFLGKCLEMLTLLFLPATDEEGLSHSLSNLSWVGGLKTSPCLPTFPKSSNLA